MRFLYACKPICAKDKNIFLAIRNNLRFKVTVSILLNCRRANNVHDQDNYLVLHKVFLELYLQADPSKTHVHH